MPSKVQKKLRLPKKNASGYNSNLKAARKEADFKHRNNDRGSTTSSYDELIAAHYAKMELEPEVCYYCYGYCCDYCCGYHHCQDSCLLPPPPSVFSTLHFPTLQEAEAATAASQLRPFQKFNAAMKTQLSLEAEEAENKYLMAAKGCFYNDASASAIFFPIIKPMPVNSLSGSSSSSSSMQSAASALLSLEDIKEAEEAEKRYLMAAKGCFYNETHQYYHNHGSSGNKRSSWNSNFFFFVIPPANDLPGGTVLVKPQAKKAAATAASTTVAAAAAAAATEPESGGILSNLNREPFALPDPLSYYRATCLAC